MSECTNARRIGLFGGTFDPVHLGHLTLAESAKRELELDKVIFIPCFISPFKTNIPPAAARHRLNMLRLSIKSNPCFKISRYELTRSSVSFTYITLKHFKKTYKRSKLFLILGTDSLSEIRSWKNFHELYKDACIIAGKRNLKQPFPYTITSQTYFLESKIPAISSTDIRKRVRLGKSIKGMVADEALKYIQKHKLYVR